LNFNHIHKTSDKYKLLIYLFEENNVYHKINPIKDMKEYNALLMQDRIYNKFHHHIKISEALCETCSMQSSICSCSDI
jgi:hypothetical protein